MKVIILQDIPKLGKRLEIKNVNEGFARNFLIPRGLAKVANKKNIKWLNDQKKELMKEKEKKVKEIKSLISNLKDKKITIKEKVGEKNQLFESITRSRIAKELKKLGFEVKEGQIELEKPIKKIGEFPIDITFDYNLKTRIRLNISAQKK